MRLTSEEREELEATSKACDAMPDGKSFLVKSWRRRRPVSGLIRKGLLAYQDRPGSSFMDTWITDAGRAALAEATPMTSPTPEGALAIERARGDDRAQIRAEGFRAGAEAMRAKIARVLELASLHNMADAVRSLDIPEDTANG